MSYMLPTNERTNEQTNDERTNDELRTTNDEQ